jgi:hypothetical protein
MKRKIFISLLIVSFFNYIGCYSYYTLTEEEIKSGRPSPDENIKLILNNGSEINCIAPSIMNSEEVYYLKVDVPGSYLMGQGTKINMSTGVTTSFSGIVPDAMIDSSSILLNNSQGNYGVWLEENECIVFQDGNYTNISSEQGTGYFIWKPKGKVQNISFSEVKEVQESYINWFMTGSLIAFFVAVFVGFGIFINEMNNFWR